VTIAVDSTTPVRANGSAFGSSVATATFDPPASVLVATIASNGNAGTGTTFSISNNGVGLAWTLIALRNKSDSGGLDGGVAAYYAVLPAARTGMTVTGGTSYLEPTLKVYVLTGVDAADVLGGSTEGSSTSTSSFTTGSFTIVRTGSLGFVACSQFQNTPAPSSSDTTFDARDGLSMGAGTGYKALGAAAGSASFNLNGNGSPSSIDWVSFEIKAAAATPSPPPNLNAWRRRRTGLLVR
jgi:hypothetical protein